MLHLRVIQTPLRFKVLQTRIMSYQSGFDSVEMCGTILWWCDFDILKFKKRSWAVAISPGWTGWVSNWSIAAFLENRASCHVFFAALRTKWWSFLLWPSTQSSIVNWGVIGIRSLFSVKIYVKQDLNRDTVHSLFCADSFPISTMRLNIDLFLGFLKWLIFTTSPVLRSHSPSSGKMKVS